MSERLKEAGYKMLLEMLADMPHVPTKRSLGLSGEHEDQRQMLISLIQGQQLLGDAMVEQLLQDSERELYRRHDKDYMAIASYLSSRHDVLIGSRVLAVVLEMLKTVPIKPEDDPWTGETDVG